MDSFDFFEIHKISNQWTLQKQNVLPVIFKQQLSLFAIHVEIQNFIPKVHEIGISSLVTCLFLTVTQNYNTNVFRIRFNRRKKL